jgi:cytochrome P450
MTATQGEQRRADIPDGLVFDYDIFWDERLTPDPHKFWVDMRAEAPDVFWTNLNGGHWVAIGSEAITKILRTPAIFSNSMQLIPKRESMPRMIPESLDPPEHLLYRRLLMTYFEPKAIEHLRQQAVEMADTLIAGFKDKGEVDFVSELARPMPVKVFMGFAGMPLDRYEEFVEMVDAFFAERTPERSGAIIRVMNELIQSKRADDDGSVLARLVRADFEGRKLTDEELQSIGYLLFLAGLDTVSNAMTFGVRHLALNQDDQAELRECPELIPTAMDELLRTYTFTAVPRLITQDIELGGAQLKADDMIMTMLPFVGRDATLNEDPDTVDFHRAKTTHFAFGSGGHTCLGRHLAKLELKAMYDRLLDQLPQFELDTSKPVGRTRGGTVTEIPQLWLRWNTK